MSLLHDNDDDDSDSSPHLYHHNHDHHDFDDALIDESWIQAHLLLAESGADQPSTHDTVTDDIHAEHLRTAALVQDRWLPATMWAWMTKTTNDGRDHLSEREIDGASLLDASLRMPHHESSASAYLEEEDEDQLNSLQASKDASNSLLHSLDDDWMPVPYDQPLVSMNVMAPSDLPAGYLLTVQNRETGFKHVVEVPAAGVSKGEVFVAPVVAVRSPSSTTTILMQEDPLRHPTTYDESRLMVAAARMAARPSLSSLENNAHPGHHELSSSSSSTCHSTGTTTALVLRSSPGGLYNSYYYQNSNNQEVPSKSPSDDSVASTALTMSSRSSSRDSAGIGYPPRQAAAAAANQQAVRKAIRSNQQHIMKQGQSGRWQSTVLSCRRDGCSWSLCLAASLCSPLLLGQIMTRVGLNARGRPLRRNQAAPLLSALTVMIIMVFVMAILDNLLSVIAIPKLSKSLAGNDNKDVPAWVFFFLGCRAALRCAFLLYFVTLLIRTRAHIRRQSAIPAQCRGGEDLLCSLACACCSLVQMAKHTTPPLTHRYTCCTETGLALRASQTVRVPGAVDDVSRLTGSVGSSSKRTVYSV